MTLVVPLSWVVNVEIFLCFKCGHNLALEWLLNVMCSQSVNNNCPLPFCNLVKYKDLCPFRSVNWTIWNYSKQDKTTTSKKSFWYSAAIKWKNLTPGLGESPSCKLERKDCDCRSITHRVVWISKTHSHNYSTSCQSFYNIS